MYFISYQSIISIIRSLVECTVHNKCMFLKYCMKSIPFLELKSTKNYPSMCASYVIEVTHLMLLPYPVPIDPRVALPSTHRSPCGCRWCGHATVLPSTHRSPCGCRWSGHPWCREYELAWQTGESEVLAFLLKWPGENIVLGLFYVHAVSMQIWQQQTLLVLQYKYSPTCLFVCLKYGNDSYKLHTSHVYLHSIFLNNWLRYKGGKKQQISIYLVPFMESDSGRDEQGETKTDLKCLLTYLLVRNNRPKWARDWGQRQKIKEKSWQHYTCVYVWACVKHKC